MEKTDKPHEDRSRSWIQFFGPAPDVWVDDDEVLIKRSPESVAKMLEALENAFLHAISTRYQHIEPGWISEDLAQVAYNTLFGD
jgi:hypothetical protein